MNDMLSEKRFEFGENWNDYLKKIDDEKIRIAEGSLKDMLETENLKGKVFLDIGSGSGLHSLCARRLGASVVSFDYDEMSVWCTEALKNKYFPDDNNWSVSRGDALDKAYMEKLAEQGADIVYSWGVLHHTGDMWGAIENACACVKPGGKLWIAIYNDQGWRSKRWLKIKRAYSNGGWLTKKFMLGLCGLQLLTFYMRDDWHHFGDPFYKLKGKNKKHYRGMAVSNDLADWAGGYPFQVAKPEEIFDFCQKKGFALTRLITHGKGHQCNQFVFEKNNRDR